MTRILLAGVPRSGTTWVGEALARAPGAAYVHEPDNHRHSPWALRMKWGLGPFPDLRPGARAPHYAALWDAAFSGAEDPDNRGRGWQQHPEWRPGIEAADAFLVGRRLPDRRAVLAAAHARRPIAPEPPPAAVIVKSVQCTLALEWIADRFTPTVAVVIRHPLNVLASWLAMQFDELGPLRRKTLRMARERWGVTPPEATAGLVERLAWRIGLFTTAVVHAARSISGTVVVHHETLCARPPDGLADLAARLGLAWTPEAAAWVRESNRQGEGYDIHRVAEEQPYRWRDLESNEVACGTRVLAQFPLGELGVPPGA